MNGINKIFLAGNLGKKPVVHRNKNGKIFSYLQIATNRFSYLDGTWSKKTLWHSVLVWGQKAEVCEKHLDKGSPLIIEGFLDDSQENKATIIAEDVHFLGLRTIEEERDSKELPPITPGGDEAESL